MSREKIDAIDWLAAAEDLDAGGRFVIPGLLDAAGCRELAGTYPREACFRKHVDMARHGYGSGHYKYFSYPLPGPVEALRRALFPPLAQIANRWQDMLGSEERFPASLDEYLHRCHAAGQARPTPLLLRYRAGDYNCLHQDVYGPLLFPLQVTLLLSRPGEDFTGGEFILTEQRPRRQAIPRVVPLAQGDAVIFASSLRPVPGRRGPVRATMRHGVSALHSGERFTAGIIFHDAA